MNRLRFIDDEARPGALNMALDYYLANNKISDEFLLTLRLYRWDKPTLSCGFHQRIEQRVDLAKCQEKGVAIVRRPTGGRELLHDGDLSFSISGRNLKMESLAKETLHKASMVIYGGLKEMGINAQIMSRAKKTTGLNSGPCLAVTSEFEIASDGRKIVPLAQRIFRDSVLVHGSIPLTKTKIATASLLKIGNPELIQKQIESYATDLEQLTGNSPNIERLKLELVKVFANIFQGCVEKIAFAPDELSKASDTSNEWQIAL